MLKKTLSIEILRKIPLNIGYLLATLSHLNVRSMEIFTLFDDVKYFKIEFAKNIEEVELNDLETIIHNAFDMKMEVTLQNVELTKECINIDCDHSLTHAEISVQTSNQRGLLAFIMSCFEELCINVITAKIHSSKHKVKDSFLIAKTNNLCDNTDKIYNLLLNKGV
ncbi:MAG: hypothetical protein Q9M43_06345 [Sulfurimonas sp.]|nr:hypothetical protein [Sulfurimonas sp.]